MALVKPTSGPQTRKLILAPGELDYCLSVCRKNFQAPVIPWGMWQEVGTGGRDSEGAHPCKEKGKDDLGKWGRNCSHTSDLEGKRNSYRSISSQVKEYLNFSQPLPQALWMQTLAPMDSGPHLLGPITYLEQRVESPLQNTGPDARGGLLAQKYVAESSGCMAVIWRSR